MKFFYLLTLPFILAQAPSSAQVKDYRNVFEEIQHGFETGNVAVIASWFGTQVQVNLKGEESGYYSSNHAYYILQNYLKSRKVLRFEFTGVGENENTPFATGTVVFAARGAREVAQVYVSLSSVEKKWVIAEITIY